MHLCRIQMERKRLIDWVIFLILTLIWGSAFIVMKFTSKHLNGYQLASVRIFSAGIVFFPMAIFHLKQIPLRKLPFVITTGLLGNFFPAFLFAIAIEKKIDSSLAGILNSLTPLFVITLGFLFFHIPIRQRKLAGVIIGFIGLIILSLSKGGISLANLNYALLILLATFMYGLNVNIVTHYLKEVEPMKMATVSLMFTTFLSAIVMWQQDVFKMLANQPSSHAALLYAALLGIIGTAIATAMFYILIKRAGGLFASLVTYGIPVVAIFWGLVDNESVTLIQVSCLGLILSGVYLANRST